MCTRELTAYQNPEGGRPVFGYEGVRQGLPQIKLPCGTCPECLKDYYSMWATRGSRELSQWDSSLFITLTYDEDHLPKNKSLDKKHVQKFIKKVKKFFGSTKDNPIRQIYSGEYGGQTLRPHYHAILFNVDFIDRRRHYVTEQGHQVFTSKQLTNLWGKGHAEFGYATPASIAYLFKYILKKKTRKEKRKPLTLDIDGISYDVAHEFIEPSRNPGIGAYFRGSESLKKGYLTENGVKKKIPKYYMEDMKKNDLPQYESLKDKNFDFQKDKPVRSHQEKKDLEKIQKKLTDTKRRM